MTLTDKIIAYECGELEDLEVLDLFQELVDTGLAWQLQGCYGRTAKNLIEAGYIKRGDDREEENSVDFIKRNRQC